MNAIIEFLNKIRESRYGKDVRAAIADGIEQCYVDSEEVNKAKDAVLAAKEEIAADQAQIQKNANAIGNLEDLATDDKTSVVTAVNEIKGETADLKTDMTKKYAALNELGDAVFFNYSNSDANDSVDTDTNGKNLFNIADESYIVINSSEIKRYGVAINGLNGAYCLSFVEINVRHESNEELMYKTVKDGNWSTAHSAPCGVVIEVADGETLVIYDKIDTFKLSSAYSNIQLEKGTVPTEYEPYNPEPAPDPTPTEKILKFPFVDVESVESMTDTTLLYRFNSAIYYHDGSDWVSVKNVDTNVDNKKVVECEVSCGTGKVVLEGCDYSRLNNLILYAGEKNESEINFSINGDNLFDFDLAKDISNWIDRISDLGRYIFPIKIDNTKKYSITIPDVYFAKCNIGLRSSVTGSESSWIRYGSSNLKSHTEINGSVYTEGYIYLTLQGNETLCKETISIFENVKIQEGKYRTDFANGSNRSVKFTFANPLKKLQVDADETFVDDEHIAWVSDSADFKRKIIIRRVSEDGTSIITPTIEEMPESLCEEFRNMIVSEKSCVICNDTNSHMEISFAINNKYYVNFLNRLILNEDFSAFAKFGVISDSLGVGNETNPTTKAVKKRNIYYSWGQQIARKCGNVCLNFGFTGATTKTWWDGGNGDGIMRYPRADFENPDNRCQAYIVGIGTNDDSSNIGNISDVNFTDYNLNADSFYGNFTKIIQNINNIYPESKVFVFTIPFSREDNNKNHAIKEISERSELHNVYLIDLAKGWKKYFFEENSHEYNYHYGVAGYADLGRINYMAISDYMHRNPTDFIGISFIPYGSNNVID